VIADVADKGMPAALFMTLVRTLLRAAVRDNHSTADTLREVNELLVPDAKNGMFVTIVYGILSPDTGEFTYTNAGHVPPILIGSASQGLAELMPSSMALGVISGIPIEEHSLQVSRGDSLIFYTDGVTEAFSPSGDMYGSERLKSLMLEHEVASASDLLDRIVQTVDEFTDSATMSDDLTLIALCRKTTI
jgi:sigma-B regulation protein RsbU (phosphoserine phosphatase)